MSLSRRAFCGSLAVGAAGMTCSTQASGREAPGKEDGAGLARPTPQQLAWQDMEMGLFIHFDMVTYTGKMKPRTPADVNTYNPVELDTDQWLETARAMGAQYAVFVAKHCTGFMAWQSNAYPYGVKQTKWRDGKGDVVGDFIASCNKYGIKPGLYASTTSNAWWGVDNPGRIRWGDKKQEDYAWGKAEPGTPGEEDQQSVLDALMDKYYRSVGHNANLLLNATPDTTGLIPEIILPHYANFGKEIKRRFGRSVAETKGEGATVELALKAPATIDHVIIMEDLRHGERVRAYELEGLVPGNTWRKLGEGISVGHKRIQKFDRTEVAAIRFHATKTAATPSIRRLAVFDVG
jgi:alpha-L-fucosidase